MKQVRWVLLKDVGLLSDVLIEAAGNLCWRRRESKPQCLSG